MAKEKKEQEKAPQNTTGVYFYPDQQIAVQASKKDEADEQRTQMNKSNQLKKKQ